MPSASSPIHEDQPVLTYGAPLDTARYALILLHGRGATAQGMLSLADALDTSNVAVLAPQAHRRTWYPQSFMAPRDANEPYLTSALHTVDRLVARATADRPAARVVLLGFSQGACLSLEYAARHPQRYGGVVGLSGGLIGPPDADLHHDGSLDGTPVFMGCSDDDPHIPAERVHASAEALRTMEAAVELRIYPGLGHTTNDDELSYVRSLFDETQAAGASASE
ncbi:alpha/beta hydrolase [Salisaeta longa]|uniref:alpha/beta hydrolase n=1 Tax=Salisaeta longa TaxID=503170 RepID=UPI0003B36701|nr:alpha/beta fold hydrolase [Salisaeta longa]